MSVAKNVRIRTDMCRALAAIGALATLLQLGPLASVGSAQTPLYDHLECFRLRAHDTPWTANAHSGDPLALGVPPAFAPPFIPLESGCELVLGGRASPQELCVAVDKSPNRPPTGSNVVDAYACYDLKCRRSAKGADVPLTDQFGSGSVVLREGRRTLCVPATIP